jgi:hypothetical protein
LCLLLQGNRDKDIVCRRSKHLPGVVTKTPAAPTR